MMTTVQFSVLIKFYILIDSNSEKRFDLCDPKLICVLQLVSSEIEPTTESIPILYWLNFFFFFGFRGSALLGYMEHMKAVN